MDAFGDENRTRSWWSRNRWTIVALILIVLLAGTLRIAFNYGPATNGGHYRYAGNDDYYHARVVERVQLTGNHVVDDPLLNYPSPAKNPRPPLFDWHMAILGQVIGFISGEATPGHAALNSGKYAVEWGSAFFGTLTVIPIWMIGRATFGNRAGLWAAFLLAASPAHIQRAGFGLGDHDAFIVFFLCMGVYFLLRALQLTRDDVRVETWTRLDNVGHGFGDYFFSHTEGVAYAALAGVCWAAIGLAWEGYPYVIAIYAVYYTFQLISNQMRRRDSTGDFLVFTTVISIMTVLTIPYYWITGNTFSTLTSTAYVIAVLCILSMALIPTRDLPAILVLPGLVLIGLLGIVVLFLVIPDVGHQLISANGYFNQSKLYSTIAEAQRTQLGVFVFSIGFLTWFFAIIGFVMATTRYFRTKDRAMLFLVGWGLLSIYMGFAASRFVFNAAPVFSVLAGWVTVRIIDWMNFKERLKNFQSLRQESFFKATRSTLGVKQIAGCTFLLLFLIVPNLWFSVDAGIPSEFRDNVRHNHPDSYEFIANRTGAFGQGFLAEDWLKVYGWLDTQDTNQPEAQRPAHIAWWDYGFWEVEIGHHPTVADNFQFGHQIAGRFLAAQSEQEGIAWLSIRLLEGDRNRHQLQFSEPVRALLADTNATWPSGMIGLVTPDHYDDGLKLFDATLPGIDATVAFYEKLQAATGTSIKYFLTDDRMLPYDSPSTSYIDSGSILYAPVYLANRNPDDFVQTVYVDTRSNEYHVQAYTTVNGVSRQEDPPKILDDSGQCYIVGGGLIYRASHNCRQIDFHFNNGQGVQLQATRLKFKDAYYNTMYYKGYIGGDKPIYADQPGGEYPQEAFVGNGTAGKGLAHFRLVNGTAHVKLLEYYAGAVVTGRATLSGGAPIAGYTVVAEDPLGIEHGRATTGPDGSYRVLAPFQLPGEGPVKIALKQGDSQIMLGTVNVSKDAAMHVADYNFTVDLNVQPGTLNGFVFHDVDGSGSYNASVDVPLDGASVLVDGRNFTSGADGHFTVADALPGSKQATATKPGFDVASGSATLAPGGTAALNITMRASRIAVNGTLKGQDGAALASFDVAFTAADAAHDHTENATATTDGSGFFSTSVVPGGTYHVMVNGTTTESNRTVRYVGTATIDAPIGHAAITLDTAQFAWTRTEEP